MSSSADTAAQFTEVSWAGHRHRIEYKWIDAAKADAPLLIFLHEGLGSIAIWKNFPTEVCRAAGCRGLLFSRWGYGASTPRKPDEQWAPDYLHQQAQLFLPAFFTAIGLDTAKDRPWFYGHSDGGSIALIHAASFPDQVAGIIVAAPHISVEDKAIEGLQAVRALYETTDLADRLRPYQSDPDSAFGGWNGAWLNPAFRDWNIEAMLTAITCPVLAIQGHRDEYATMWQIDGIAAAAPQTQLLKLDTGHTPHRDAPERVTRAITDFMAAHSG